MGCKIKFSERVEVGVANGGSVASGRRAKTNFDTLSMATTPQRGKGEHIKRLQGFAEAALAAAGGR
jgi:hypothetical protein